MASDIQSEAMERLRQMYQNAKPVQEQKKPKVAPKKNDEQEKEPVAIQMPNSKGVFDFILQDKEKSLILILLVILLSEKADESLILALVYLIL